MRLLTLSLLFITTTSAFSQAFEKTYGGDGFDRGMHILPTDDRGWIACGYTTSFGNGYQIYLVKVDRLGNKQWEKNYGGAGFEMGWTVKKAADEGWILLGMTNSKDSLNHDIVVMKIAKDGNPVWEKTYGSEKYERATDLMPTPDGNYLISGQRNITTTNIDNYIIKIDANGNLIWDKVFGDELSQRSFYSSLTTDGDYLIAGTTMPTGTSNTDIVLTRLDKDGNIKWTKSYGKYKDHDIVHSLTRNKNGTHTLIGYRSSDRKGQHDALILQVDGNGKLLLEKTSSNGEDLRLMHAEQTPDGGFIATGFTRKDVAQEIWNAVLIKLNSAGDRQWIKSFGSPGLDDQGYWIVVNRDEGYTLTGYTHSSGKNGDLWVIRVDANGNIR